MKKIIALLFLALAMAFQSNAQETLTFEIENQTGIELYGVFVSDIEDNNWGEDIIPGDMFADNTVVNILIPINDATLCEWDIKVTAAPDDEAGVIFENLDLCVLNKLVFYLEDGKVFYKVQ